MHGTWTYDLIVVGAGPAGCAAAIHAANLKPGRAFQILLLDKARFPRVKICGGGVVRRAEFLLHRMNVHLDVHSTNIHAATFIFPKRKITIRRHNMFRIVRREEFDHALLRCAESKGIDVQQEADVLGLEHVHDGIVVRTAHESYKAKVVIGADGATGIVRKKMVSGDRRLSMVGLETVTQTLQSELSLRARHTAVFNFQCTAAGVQGYSWDFPTGPDEAPRMNRGIFHSHIGGRESRLGLKSYLADSLQERGIPTDPGQIKGHPETMYHSSAPCSAPHIVLAGDAIGVEPLLGEGISSALETGMMAAEAACRALHSGDYSFKRYDEEIRASHKGRSMRLKRYAAERFYAGEAKGWVLLGTVGMTAVHARGSQAWDGIGAIRRTARE
ncbi:MAG: geranylgeranyl reductase family protein [Chloroflexota bacterium]